MLFFLLDLSGYTSNESNDEDKMWQPHFLLETSNRRYRKRQQQRGYKNKKFNEKVTCCGRIFAYEHNYRYHKKWECGQILSCDYCQKVFKTKATLETHYKYKLIKCSAYVYGNTN